MALVTFQELFDVVVMSVAVGFIFMDVFRRLPYVSQTRAFLFSVLVTAPGIILHELGHKFVAIAFGFIATFNAAYTWLVLGIVMKLLAGFVFFVPAYVSILCDGVCVVHPLASALIAFSGPAINGLFYLVCVLLLKYRAFNPRTTVFLSATKKINGLLFVFNMLPLPFFDGFKVYEGLIRIIL